MAKKAKKKAKKEKKKKPIQEVDPRLIKFDPENVRREDEETIESDESFIRLKESIYTYGVLVPLVIKEYNVKNKKYKYLLIDGERRLRAALATNLSKVPVHVLKKKEVKKQMLYAFQIHMLRKEWVRTAQARALVKIIKDIKKQHKRISKDKLFSLLQKKTGYSQGTLRDMLRVNKYIDMGKKVLDEMDDSKNNLKFSHLVQLEASFVEQLEKSYPEVIKKYGIKAIRKLLVQKVRKKVIGSTREPILMLLPLFAHTKDTEKRVYLKRLIKEFLNKPNRTPEEICRKFELKYPSNKEDLIKLVKESCTKMEDLESILKNLNISQLKTYKKLEKNFKNKVSSLYSLIRDINSRMNG